MSSIIDVLLDFILANHGEKRDFTIVDNNTNAEVIADDSDENHSLQHQLINNFPSKHDFQRKNLTMHHPKIIIGNLEKVVKSIEQLVDTSSSNKGNFNVKENYPFICVVNPPRHGKSLLLDRLFLNRNDVCVIEMTYNSTTNLTDQESKSSRISLYYFWLRFIHAVIPFEYSLHELTDKVGPFNELKNYNLLWATNILKDVFNMIPFTNVDGTSKSLLIAVDEFSKLVDKAQSWNKDDKNSFVSALQNEHKAKPFVRFVFTSFNRGITKLMEAYSAPVMTFALSLCDFSSARPLLQQIKNQYDKKDSIENTKFPTLLYEVVKSTPGLVGLWAERLFHGTKCRDLSLYAFAEHMTWANEITNMANLQNNWDLLVRFLICLERKDVDGIESYDEELGKVGDLMITNLTGVMSNGEGGDMKVPLISPFCTVQIVRKYNFDHNVNSSLLEEKQLHAQLKSAINTCEMWSNDNGQAFENFVLSALTVRILLRMIYNERQKFLNGEIQPSSQPMVVFKFYDLFPVNKDSTFVSEMNDVDGNPFEFYIHSISDKVSLMNLLTIPLYYIFPIGTKALYTDTSVVHSTNLTSWLKLNYKLIENRKDFLVNISSDLMYKEKCNFVSKTNKDYEFSPDEEKQWSSILEPEKVIGPNNNNNNNNSDKNKVYNVWNNMQKTIEKFVEGNDKKISIFPMAKDAAGCDLVMLLREIENNKYTDDDDDNDNADSGNNNIVKNLGGIIHVIAIELKDRRETKENEWQKKIGLLTSPRCILPRLRAALLNKGYTDVCYHVIFAGREHD